MPLREQDRRARLLRPAQGQGLIEYAVLCAGIALLVAGTALALGASVDGWYTTITSAVVGAPGGSGQNGGGASGDPGAGAGGGGAGRGAGGTGGGAGGRGNGGGGNGGGRGRGN